MSVNKDSNVTNQRPLHNLYLYGPLAEYGHMYRLAGYTPAQVINMFFANFPKARKEAAEHYWEVIVGDLETGIALEPEQLNIGMGRQDLHVRPIDAVEATARLRGAKRGGGAKVIAGAVLIAAAVIMAPAAGVAAGPMIGGEAGYAVGGMGSAAFSIGSMGVSYTQIAMFGLSLALSGAAQLLTKTASVGEPTSADQNASYLFNGIQNVSAQGAAIPLVYGECMTGSVMVSAGLSNEAA